MNRQIRQLAVGLMACYVVLFVALNYWQVGRKPELDARFDNTRQMLREFNRPRGPIVTSDGVVAAVSFPTAPGEPYEYRREYPTGDLLADITGYYTFAFGSTQVERLYGDVLSGTTAEQQVRGLGDLLGGTVETTGTVELAVRNDAQEVAQFLLGGQTGSVTVIEPKTGAIRAMYSNPTYDPNTFVNADFEVAEGIITELQNADGNPLLAQAYQERYMPGSTFKVITTGIALEAGVVTLDNTFANEREWVPPQTNDPIQNYNGSLCGGDLATVFARSCNIPFAQLSTLIGPEAMVEGHQGLGHRRRVADRPAATGREHVRQHRQPGSGAPTPGDPRVRPERGADGAAAHGDGGGCSRQRRPDDEAVRRSGDLRPGRPGTRPDDTRGLEDPDLTGDRRDRAATDDRCRRTRHGQLLHRARGWHPGGGQDRDGPAR